MAKSKAKRKRKLKKNNIFLIFLIMFIILMIVGYFILGLLTTLFMGIGILIIVGLAKLVDSVKNKPKKKKVVNTILIIILSIGILVMLVGIVFMIYIAISANPKFNAEKLALDRLQFFDDDKITFTYITKKDIEELGIKAGELEGIAGIGVTIENVEVAIFAREKDDGFKISFRSNNIDVADICMLFGGGGHKLAAGCQIDTNNIEEVRKAVVSETMKHLK